MARIGYIHRERHSFGVRWQAQRDTALEWIDLLLPLLRKYVNQAPSALRFAGALQKSLAAPFGLGHFSDNSTKLTKAKFLV